MSGVRAQQGGVAGAQAAETEADQEQHAAGRQQGVARQGTQGGTKLNGEKKVELKGIELKGDRAEGGRAEGGSS